jgi:hypothetical protein
VLKQTFLTVAIAAALCSPSFAFAEATADPGSVPATPDGGGPDPTAADTTTLHSVEVNAALDKARNQLSPEIGASQYVISQQSIQQLPLGDATPLNQVLLQVPGFVQDSYGQLHVRGDHADLQYRVNGVIIPESISGFGQTLDTRLIDSIQVLTGALPAQYGYRTAGVVDITSKPAPNSSGGSIGVTAGSFGTVNPEFSLFGNQDRWTYFLTGSFLESDIGIENPTSSRSPIHDHTDQAKGFGYLSYLLNDDARVSFMFGVNNSRFQIPNNPGQDPAYTLDGVDNFDSAKLDERQRETTHFGVLALQGKFNDTTSYQISLGQRYTSVNYRPDPIGDLILMALPARSIAPTGPTRYRRTSPHPSAMHIRSATASM